VKLRTVEDSLSRAAVDGAQNAARALDVVAGEARAQAGRFLTEAQAAELISRAGRIKTVLGFSP
jgi:hypothetical protein